MIIVFEGIDGAGKQTQSRLLSESLSAMNVKTLLLSYPDYSSAYGKMIDSYLHGAHKPAVRELFFLYAIDQVKDELRIKEALNEGKVVIMDRYLYSTVAYQSAGGLDYSYAKAMEELIALPKPDVVFYLDISVNESMERKRRQKGTLDIHESAIDYLQKVRQNYDMLCNEQFYGKWIKADGTNKSISDMILSEVKALMKTT